MHNPAIFRQTDPDVLVEAVRSVALGELITFGAHGIEATLVPLLIDDDATRLTGHLARANRQWVHADVGVPALVTWTGPDVYISPSSYPSKAEHGRVVPTWNYITVQARGRLVVHDDPAWTRNLVRDLTEHHERERESPWGIDDAPEDFIDAMVKAIVGIEVEITSIEGKWKVSQNRPPADAAGVISALSRPGATDASVAIAEAVSSLQQRPQPRPGDPA